MGFIVLLAFNFSWKSWKQINFPQLFFFFLTEIISYLKDCDWDLEYCTLSVNIFCLSGNDRTNISEKLYQKSQWESGKFFFINPYLEQLTTAIYIFWLISVMAWLKYIFLQSCSIFKDKVTLKEIYLLAFPKASVKFCSLTLKKTTNCTNSSWVFILVNNSSVYLDSSYQNVPKDIFASLFKANIVSRYYDIFAV